jgi:hypothetical protein
MRYLDVAAAIALAIPVSASAASAHASLTDFGFTLQDLDATDGITPSLVAEPRGPLSEFQIFAGSDRSQDFWSGGHIKGGLFGEREPLNINEATASFALGLIHSPTAAVLDGTARMAGSYVQARVAGSAPWEGRTYFILSPMSQVTVSFAVDLRASARNWCESAGVCETAWASAGVNFAGSDLGEVVLGSFSEVHRVEATSDGSNGGELMSDQHAEQFSWTLTNTRSASAFVEFGYSLNLEVRAYTDMCKRPSGLRVLVSSVLGG